MYGSEKIKDPVDLDKSVAILFIPKKSYFWQSFKIDQYAYGQYIMCHGQEL